MLTKTFRHPVVGDVTVDCDALTLTDRDQRLVLYSAPSAVTMTVTIVSTYSTTPTRLLTLWLYHVRA